MKLHEYRHLTMDDKADVLFLNGELLENCVYKGISHNLYGLFDFYVEVILDKVTFRITEITPFHKGKRLDKYLDKINLMKLHFQ